MADQIEVDGVTVQPGDVVTVEHYEENVGAVLEREEEQVTGVSTGTFVPMDYIEFGRDTISLEDIESVEKHD